MATRGVYSKAMQKMIDDTNKLCEERTGWAKTKVPMFISEKMLEHYGSMVDWWNPLWRDPYYAQNTRWGKIMAAPFYQNLLGMVQFDMEANPECGYGGPGGRGDFGNDWEFFRPIRANDTIRVWQYCEFEDVTIDGKDTPHVFDCTASYDHINQNDELVSSCHIYLGNAFYAKPLPPREHKETEYQYSQGELEYIRKLEDEEEILGAKIRYWEDVKAGDEIKSVVRGPTTVLDMVRYFGYYMVGYTDQYFGDIPPMRELTRKYSKFIKVDPVTNVSHDFTEQHLWDRAGPSFGGKYAIELLMSQRSLIARAVTNWMGDDGFIRKFIFRTNGTEILKDVLDKECVPMAGMMVGSTNIARGKVVNKRVENNESLVDLVMWTEDITGAPSKGAKVTVSLLSKETPLKWVKR
jgi:hypothetical protein